MGVEMLEDIEEELFNQQDIDFVTEKVEVNLPILFGQDETLEEDEEFETVKLMLKSMCNSENLEKLLKKYESLLTNSIERQNCLAYYIGLKKGLELNNLK